MPTKRLFCQSSAINVLTPAGDSARVVAWPGGLRSEPRFQESDSLGMTWPRISPAGNLAVCMFA